LRKLVSFSAVAVVAVTAGALSGCSDKAAITASRQAASRIDRSVVAGVVASEAKKQGVPVRLALAVAKTESNFNAGAVSPVGALGAMQVMPQTARLLGHVGPDTDLFDPRVNAWLGCKYLKQGLDESGARWAVARYHGGPDTRMHGPKTRRYIKLVMARYYSGRDLPDPDGWLDRRSTDVRLALASLPPQPPEK
jgi:soluble lytic murein transglycosylase-like protein